MSLSIQNGMTEENRKKAAQALSHVLADTYSVYLMTQFFHWNVTGPLFHALHLMTDEQYANLAEAVDTVAERIRALGAVAPGSFAAFEKLSRIKTVETVPSAEQMIQTLVAAHDQTVRAMRETKAVLEDLGDDPSADMLIERMEWHEKTAWMLRSLLG